MLLQSEVPVDGRRHWSGRLKSFEDGVVVVALEKEGGAESRVPFAKIAHGRLEIEFPKS
jgi:ribosome maturation factor RimP